MHVVSLRVCVRLFVLDRGRALFLVPCFVSTHVSVSVSMHVRVRVCLTMCVSLVCLTMCGTSPATGAHDESGWRGARSLPHGPAGSELEPMLSGSGPHHTAYRVRCKGTRVCPFVCGHVCGCDRLRMYVWLCVFA